MRPINKPSNCSLNREIGQQKPLQIILYSLLATKIENNQSYFQKVLKVQKFILYLVGGYKEGK
jgi:hypothetical protein